MKSFNVNDIHSGYPYNKFIRITPFGGWIGNFWWVNRDPSNMNYYSFRESWIGSFGFDGKPQFILGIR